MTIFNIKMNSITKRLTPGIDDYLYVDKLLRRFQIEIYVNSRAQLQQCIQKITHLANTNGFRITDGKTQCVHFCQLRKMHDDPLIKLEDTEIPVVDEYKFLGVIFDRKLTFIPHLKYLKTKSTRA